MDEPISRTHIPMDVQPDTHINAPVNVHGWCFGLIPANGNWLDDIIDWQKRQFRQAAVARRLAACWNACSSISTEDLERYFGASAGIEEAKAMKRTRHMAAIYDGIHAALDAARSTRTMPEQHPDDIAVDWFADAMKEKMAKQRARGYGGWEDTVGCPTGRLQLLLSDHVGKGDPIDVGNIAMMLWNRGEKTAPAQGSGKRAGEQA